MRKGSCTANARPLFFEKELFYCKLTVASDIQKGLLHVSFGAVGNCCRGMLKKAFLFRFALHELKKTPLSRIKKIFISRSFTNFTRSRFLRTKTSFCTCLSLLVSKTAHFHKPKDFLLHKPFLLPPKATLFCPPPPLPTTLNLLFAKTAAVLLLFALILCCKAGASHRFKSLPAIPGKLLFSALPVT